VSRRSNPATAGPAASGADASLSVTGQVARSAEEAGDEFDADALTIMLRLYCAIAAVERTHAAELAPYRLSLSQFQILSTLHRASGPLPMRELAAAVSVRAANLTGLVDVLARRSLVGRAINPSDRRSFLVSLTPEGEEFLQGFLPGHWRYLNVLTSQLSKAEKTQLSDLLERLERSIDAAPPIASLDGHGSISDVRADQKNRPAANGRPRVGMR
jgi:DNA-binding MarR family transcriptional regulator